MSAAPCWVVFFHYVRPGPAGAGIRGLTPERFSRQLDTIAAAADIIGYDEFAAALHARRDFARPAALLTFDDGLADHRDVVWPELRRRGLSGLFFVNGAPLADRPAMMNVHRAHRLLDVLGAGQLRESLGDAVRDATVGGPMPDLYRYDDDAEQVVKRLLNYELPYPIADAALSALFARHCGDEEEEARRFYLSAGDVSRMASEGARFGFHTERHRVLARLDPREQRAELARGPQLIRALTHRPDVPFCFPYGHRSTYTDATVRLLGELGYAMAFTTTRAPVFPSAGAPFELPRFDTRDLEPEGTMAISPVGAPAS